MDSNTDNSIKMYKTKKEEVKWESDKNPSSKSTLKSRLSRSNQLNLIKIGILRQRLAREYNEAENLCKLLLTLNNFSICKITYDFTRYKWKI